MSTPAPTFLSGIQPSGRPHIGNYFGAIRPHIASLEEAGEHFFFIADYHALTTIQDAEVLRTNVRDVAATYFALGMDPERASFFRQSDVPEVTEISWLLTTVTGMGLLERAHSYKDKIANGIKPSVGLFTYPVLMAADILAYDSTVVPVGKDQIQHVE
ncbi:MAG: tryptophan--tRNA ligase, partial [Planctomycetota bacterium]